MDPERLRCIFAHHPPNDDAVIAAHAETRNRMHDVAQWVNENIPDCPERDEALHQLDLACRAVNAAIARTQLGY